MAKIGTAQIEIKPVLNVEALQSLIDRIMVDVEQAVAVAISDGIARGLSSGSAPANSTEWHMTTTYGISPDNPTR